MSKQVDKNYNSALIGLLTERPIAFNTTLAKVARSASAGLFISQLLYWWGKGSEDGSIYKTIREIEEETVLTRWEQAAAIRAWTRLGILEVELRGLPRKRHFKIHIKRIVPLIESTLGSRYVRKTSNRFVESDNLEGGGQRANTESTHESTNKDQASQACDENNFAAARRDLGGKLSVQERRQGGR